MNGNVEHRAVNGSVRFGTEAFTLGSSKVPDILAREAAAFIRKGREGNFSRNAGSVGYSTQVGVGN